MWFFRAPFSPSTSSSSRAFAAGSRKAPLSVFHTQAHGSAAVRDDVGNDDRDRGRRRGPDGADATAGAGPFGFRLVPPAPAPVPRSREKRAGAARERRRRDAPSNKDPLPETRKRDGGDVVADVVECCSCFSETEDRGPFLACPTCRIQFCAACLAAWRASGRGSPASQTHRPSACRDGRAQERPTLHRRGRRRPGLSFGAADVLDAAEHPVNCLLVPKRRCGTVFHYFLVEYNIKLPKQMWVLDAIANVFMLFVLCLFLFLSSMSPGQNSTSSLILFVVLALLASWAWRLYRKIFPSKKTMNHRSRRRGGGPGAASATQTHQPSTRGDVV